MRVGGFEFGERFLQAVERGVWIIIVGGVGDGRDNWKRTRFGTELGEQLFQLEPFVRRERMCGTETLLDLRDGVLDHE